MKHGVILFAFALLLDQSDGFSAKHGRIAAKVVTHPDSASHYGSFGEPVVGWVSNDSQTEIREIRGVPGATLFSDPLVFPAGTKKIFVSSVAGLGMVERTGDGPLSLTDLRTPEKLVDISGAAKHPDDVAFSPAGASAVIYSWSGATLQVVSGLNGTAAVSWQAGIDSFFGGVASFAVSDDGKVLLVSSSLGAVFSVQAGGIVTPVFQGGSPRFSFLQNSKDAVLSDSKSASVWRMTGVDAVPQLQPLGQNLPGFTNATRIQQVGSSVLAVVTQPGIGHLTIFNMADGTSRGVDLPVSPTTLKRMRAPGVLLVSHVADQPGWILEATSNHASVTFVPQVSGPITRVILRRKPL